MFSLVSTALAFHVVPNIIMKGVKSTHTGHKILTSTFSAGITLGRQGKVINPITKQFMKYGVGPESLIEYEIGLKIGTDLQTLTPLEQEVYLQAFKQEIRSNLETLSEEEIAEARKTPFVNTFIAYANNESYTFLEEIITKTSKEKNVSNIFAITMFLSTMLLLAVIEPHILFQPVISFIREKVGTSSFGKTYLKNNFTKGVDGRISSKTNRAIIDLLVSPSALDTMRLGNYIQTSSIPVDVKNIFKGE